MGKAEKIEILNKRLSLFQAENGFRTSLDSVMLAAACPTKPGEHILDLGCGIGGAGFCLLARMENTKLTGIDIQADHIELARKNAAMNDMADRTEFIHADIRKFKGGSFSHVICNPPYLEPGKHLPSPHKAKAAAHAHGEETGLKDWIDCAFRHIKAQGSLTLIHRADQTDEIIRLIGKRFGAIEIIPLWPKLGVDAKRVIIRAVKHRKSPARLHAGLVLHQENGNYTDEAQRVLREAAPIL